MTIVREATLPSLQERFVAQAGVGVERAGYQVLRGVAQGAPVRLADLAHRLGVDASTVSRQVKALERRGLVARSGAVVDRRAAQVSLTDAGVEALGRLQAARHRFFAEVLAGWSPSEREALAPLLDRLARDLLAEGGRL